MSTKKHNGGGGATAPEGSWTCRCGNVNYPERMFCNTKTCSLPRAQGDVYVVNQAYKSIEASSSDPLGCWKCGSCGNLNYPTRTRCNRSTCQRPRMDFGGYGRTAPNGTAPMGSWTCQLCGNLNYAHRTVCNSGKCRLPRHANSNVIAMGMTKTSMKKTGMMAKGVIKTIGDKHPAGCWKCECGNLNYPERAHCNRRTCGKARVYETGTWTCVHCGNENYPKRTHCNRKTCAQPREHSTEGYPEKS